MVSQAKLPTVGPAGWPSDDEVLSTGIQAACPYSQRALHKPSPRELLRLRWEATENASSQRTSALYQIDFFYFHATGSFLKPWNPMRVMTARPRTSRKGCFLHTRNIPVFLCNLSTVLETFCDARFIFLSRQIYTRFW